MTDNEKFIRDLAERSLAGQTRSENDYYNEEGLLVCGTCGMRKEKYVEIPFSDHTVIKVGCVCKCQAQELKKTDERLKAREEAEKNKRLRKASLIDARFNEARFENWKVREDNKVIFKRCKKYAESFDVMMDKNCGLLFWGPVGTGKSFASACIANYLLDKGTPIIMTSFVKLLDMCNKDQENAVLEQIEQVKLVIFDDLGAERGTDYALEKVYNIVDSRYRSKLPMIVTTNQSLNAMVNETDIRYSRIYDRLFETCYPMEFKGNSWRKRDAYKMQNSIGAFLDSED